MARIFSGIQPTGDLHLGNYLGAARRWVAMQDEDDCIYCIVDLHALSLPHDPPELRSNSIELARMLLAIGLDPERCILFLQGHVHQHNELAWLLECTVSFGELRRMTQFKEKGDRADFVSAGLFTYPALQAADILLYDTGKVPVGDDQRQHLELTRDVAERFNSRFGATFVVPEHVIPKVGARVMDLQNPAAKMSKSADSPTGTVLVLDDPAAIERKIKRAVTDTETEVRFDPEAKPGVSNLLEILAACTGDDPAELAGRYTQYGPLKADTAAAVIDVLTPIQRRYRELGDDPGEILKQLEVGAAKAEEIASRTVAKARDAIGLVPRPNP
ncbi:MAG: tryptophan--tRNA ligase [Acidimicrobiales bacterium]